MIRVLLELLYSRVPPDDKFSQSHFQGEISWYLTVHRSVLCCLPFWDATMFSILFPDLVIMTLEEFGLRVGVDGGRLTGLLKEAMQHGQVGKPTVHLVEVMSAMKHPFFMFVCSNCFCDICDKVRLLGYWSPVESHIFHHVLRKYGCRDGKALVVDVGAHVGWFSLVSASYGCRVVSFEPNTVALRYLNLSRVINNLHHQVALYPKGVGIADSQAEYRHVPLLPASKTGTLNSMVVE